jgi:lia operon protein LiaG
MSRPRPAAVSLVLAVLAVVPALVPLPAGAAEGHHTLLGPRVHVYNLAGSVELVAGDGNEVVVRSTTGGRDGAQVKVHRMPGAEPAIVFQYPGRKLVYPRSAGRGSFRSTIDVGADGRFGDGWGKNGLGVGRRKVEIRSSGEGLEAWTDLRISVPRGQRAAIHLGVGGVSVTNVDGELLVDCAAAGVEAAGTRGSLRIDTGSGGVDVRDARGHLSVDTGSGGVSVIDFQGSNVDVDTGSGSVKMAAVTATMEVGVDTGSGRVEIVDVRAPRVGVDTGSGSVFVRLAANVEHLTIDTGSGAVSVEAPTTLDATVRMETGSGGLDVDFPMNTVSRDGDSLSGTIGQGKGRIQLETGSGRIKLSRV